MQGIIWQESLSHPRLSTRMSSGLMIMNLWYPIGILLSLYIIYSSYKDDQALRTAPDRFLLNSLRGEGGGFYLTLQSALGRITRQIAPELGQIEDPVQRQQHLEQRVLAMPRRERILRMTLWEIRFRGVAFAFFAIVLLYDLLTTGGSFTF